MSRSAQTGSTTDEEKRVVTHLKLGDELCKDGEEGFRAAGLAVLSEVGGHLGELLHRSCLQGLQGLDRGVAVLQETLRVQMVKRSWALVAKSKDQCVCVNTVSCGSGAVF